MADMSRRLHRLLNEIDSLTLHNATYRLVRDLLGEPPDDVPQPPEIVLTAPKHIIASRLSIKPETFSRTLTRLSRDGLTAVRGNSIVLGDLRRLRQEAELWKGRNEVLGARAEGQTRIPSLARRSFSWGCPSVISNRSLIGP